MKEKCEIKLQQLENQERKIKRQISQEERKKRTRRLIERGAILESLTENAGELTDEEIKILLEKATKTKEFKEPLKIIRQNEKILI
ncbi:MAG: DUF3847 domain-containing protein [Helcococcus sp.]|nr:DUF3847 domain-containing protein [Helcococcus sp.]